MANWKPAVRTDPNDPKFYTNALVFATQEEAQASAEDLMSRWLLVIECKTIETDDPVTCTRVDGRDSMMS